MYIAYLRAFGPQENLKSTTSSLFEMAYVMKSYMIFVRYLMLPFLMHFYFQTARLQKLWEIKPEKLTLGWLRCTVLILFAFVSKLFILLQ